MILKKIFLREIFFLNFSRSNRLILRKIFTGAFPCYSKLWLLLLKIQGLQASTDKVEADDG